MSTPKVPGDVSDLGVSDEKLREHWNVGQPSMLGADTLLNEAIRRGAVIAALGGQTVCPACKESPMDVSCACCGHGYPAKAELEALQAKVKVYEDADAAAYKSLWEALGKSPGEDYPTKWQWILDAISTLRSENAAKDALTKAQHKHGWEDVDGSALEHVLKEIGIVIDKTGANVPFWSHACQSILGYEAYPKGTLAAKDTEIAEARANASALETRDWAKVEQDLVAKDTALKAARDTFREIYANCSCDDDSPGQCANCDRSEAGAAAAQAALSGAPTGCRVLSAEDWATVKKGMTEALSALDQQALRTCGWTHDYASINAALEILERKP
jgi:hypothetical protein